MCRCDDQGWGEMPPQEGERCGPVINDPQPGPGAVATMGKEGMEVSVIQQL